MAEFNLSNREFEKLTTEQKIQYFSKLKDLYIQKTSSKKETKFNIGRSEEHTSELQSH